MATQPDFQTAFPPRPGRKYFTVQEANEALPYVRRVLEDIRRAFREALELKRRLEQQMPGDETDDLRRRYDHAYEELNRFRDEIESVGVELKDYDAGLIDFPALHEGREVLLCWRSGEQKIEAWHEIPDGFAGRQDVALLEEEPGDNEL